MRSEIISERSRWIKPLEKSIGKIESEIEQHEKKLAEDNNTMQVLSQSGNGAEIGILSQDIHLRNTEIERLFTQYEELTEQIDHHHQRFQKQLEQLGLD